MAIAIVVAVAVADVEPRRIEVERAAPRPDYVTAKEIFSSSEKVSRMRDSKVA